MLILTQECKKRKGEELNSQKTVRETFVECSGILQKERRRWEQWGQLGHAAVNRTSPTSAVSSWQWCPILEQGTWPPAGRKLHHSKVSVGCYSPHTRITVMIPNDRNQRIPRSKWRRQDDILKDMGCTQGSVKAKFIAITCVTSRKWKGTKSQPNDVFQGSKKQE